MEEMKKPEWYIIHVYSGYENSVEQNLHNMIENIGLQDYITDIKVPMFEDTIEKDGKMKTILRKKFPSYVFVKMIYTNDIWYKITNTRGVTGFVGPKGRPQPITPDEVKKCGLEVIEIEDFDIKVGDNVKVINGPLLGFIGTFDSINAETQKVKLTVTMFGRLTPVELDFSQIEKL